MKLLGAALIVGAVVAGCTEEDPGSTIVVAVASDLQTPDEIDGVDIAVAGGALRFSFPLGDGPSLHRLPVQAAVTAGGRRDREFEVEAVGRKGAHRLLSQTATVSFKPGAAQELRLFLARSCLMAGACPADSSCQDGACISRREVGARRTLAPGERPGPVTPVDAGSGDGSLLDTRPGDGGGPDTAADRTMPDAADAGGVSDTRPQRRALLVVGDPTLPTAGDARLRDVLAANGFEVQLGDDDAPVSIAGSFALVVLTSSCSSSALGSKFRDVATPVLTLDAAVFGAMGLTGPVAGMDHGEEPGTYVEIVRNGHPLAAGLTGAVRVVARSAAMSWGRPSPAAERIATSGVPLKCTIFSYEKDAVMVGAVAPARRVSFFAADAAAASLSDEGVRLLGAAVDWATE